MQNKITFDQFFGSGNIVSLYYHHSYEDSFTKLGSVDYDQIGVQCELEKPGHLFNSVQIVPKTKNGNFIDFQQLQFRRKSTFVW